MSKGGKVIFTIGVASSTLFATWLLTGSRKVKAKKFVARSAGSLKHAIKSQKVLAMHDQESCYI